MESILSRALLSFQGKKFAFSGTPRIPAPAEESPRLTTPGIYFLPVGDVNSSETFP